MKPNRKKIIIMIMKNVKKKLKLNEPDIPPPTPPPVPNAIRYDLLI